MFDSAAEMGSMPKFLPIGLEARGRDRASISGLDSSSRSAQLRLSGFVGLLILDGATGSRVMIRRR